MDDSGEVEAYAGASSEDYLSRIDDTFVERALSLVALRGVPPGGGRALDIGCGPGQIARKIAQRLPGWRIVGIDRSAAMLEQARASGAPGAADGTLLEFSPADGTNLPFPDASFDLVICNSVLHHLEKPQRLVAGMARVADPRGAILLRDLRRPSRLAFGWHARWYGRRYSGVMLKLYRDSLRAAYTPEELTALLRASPVPRARIFTEGRTHLGFARPAADPPSSA